MYFSCPVIHFLMRPYAHQMCHSCVFVHFICLSKNRQIWNNKSEIAAAPSAVRPFVMSKSTAYTAHKRSEMAVGSDQKGLSVKISALRVTAKLRGHVDMQTANT